MMRGAGRARSLAGVLAVGASCPVACDAESVVATPDARSYTPRYDAGYVPPSSCQVGALTVTAECRAGVAETEITNWYMAPSNQNSCTSTLYQSSAQCAAGCAIQGRISISGGQAFEEWIGVRRLATNASALCAETPSAQLGQVCTTDGSKPCLPTRAALKADGTVASQQYLRCDGTTYTCAPASAPSFDYLTPCSTTTVSTYGTPGVNGAVSTCLLAWDAATQQLATGTTRTCLGDWHCPQGALCDDQITWLDTTYPWTGVCKPGPRGVLTAAMLSP